MRSVWDFDTGAYLGAIPQPAHTLNVVSHANEMGVVIAETTHGGLANLTGGNGTLDYGSLIAATLQRASTAREAVRTVASLADDYGYASSAEGFSISDGDECWYMELIGKGAYEKGLLWVALRVPDGYFTANANQARITTFLPCDDENHCMMANDTVTFAIAHGLFHGAPTDPSFSFSDTYDPVTPTGARFCEARVWYVFRELADPASFDADYYLPYAQGFNLTRRMPLWVRPKRKLERADLHALLSAKYEGSFFDPTLDVGAGAEASPYRWNGLSWTAANKSFVNERIAGTQYTAWHWVASVRGASVPPQLRAALVGKRRPCVRAQGAALRLGDGCALVLRRQLQRAPRVPTAARTARLDARLLVGFGVLGQLGRRSLVYLDPSRAAPVVACARAESRRGWRRSSRRRRRSPPRASRLATPPAASRCSRASPSRAATRLRRGGSGCGSG